MQPTADSRTKRLCSTDGIRRLSAAIVLVSIWSLGWGCGDRSKPTSSEDFRSLEPYPNRLDELTDLWEPQPSRNHPRDLVVVPERGRLYATLQGAIDDPGHQVAVIDLAKRREVRRFDVGRSPTGLALHPNERHLVVTNRYSNFLSIIDLETSRVTRKKSDFYLIQAAFGPDGERLYATNRQHDTLQAWDLRVDGGELKLDRVRPSGKPNGVPVGQNPRNLVVSRDGESIYVGTITGLTISRIDSETLEERNVESPYSTHRSKTSKGIDRLDVGAPPRGMAVEDGHIYVATLSRSTGHPAFTGPDTDGDGQPGDGTPNRAFNDLQNEIAVFRTPNLQDEYRYTSDSLCCPDNLDVTPWETGGELLPTESLRIVGGALPEDVAVAHTNRDDYLIVTYAGSNEIQRFTIRSDGALEPGPIARVGFNPSAVAIEEERDEVYVANRLEETISIVELSTLKVKTDVSVGEQSEKPFPATDAEIGELFFFAGADFSVDGDQTCAHCHPSRGNVDKVFALRELADPRGSRVPPVMRGLLETRPWFWEGARDEFNIFPDMFARRYNFCCHELAEEEDHAIDLAECADNPPEACSERSHPHDVPTLDHFYRDAARKLTGRTRSFGGAIDVPLDFEGITRLLGLFLIHEPALFPNPNSSATPAVRRGRRIFNSPTTGCSVCHPRPAFAVSLDYNPFDTPLNFGPLITPRHGPQGENIDLLHEGFLRSFPMAEQAEDIHINPPGLLGIWDRAQRFYHDGRARSLRETLCPPNHPALRPGESGFNELDGMPDTHGGTSHLNAEQLSDLIAFLRSL